MARQPHRIIVEGMDGSGKSTLIADLTHRFPKLEIVTRPQGIPFNTWWPFEMERTSERPIPIHDRFFYSELVYGPILRGRIEVNTELLNTVVWFLRSVAMLIYVRPHSDTIRANCIGLPQMEGVLANFQQLLESYDKVMMAEIAWYGDRFYHYDWNSGHNGDVIQAVDHYLS